MKFLRPHKSFRLDSKFTNGGNIVINFDDENIRNGTTQKLENVEQGSTERWEIYGLSS